MLGARIKGQNCRESLIVIIWQFDEKKHKVLVSLKNTNCTCNSTEGTVSKIAHQILGITVD